ncbi:MAG: hypothetical protein PHY43_03870 [Verrucomicrobiales bacterium]|nr:hypothetical protein [Verrucomicrobiales bacterium]
METAIALILANLPTIIQTGEAGWKWITSVRAAAKQSGEWTESIEADFQAKLASESLDPAWQLHDAPAVTVQADAPAPAPEVPLGTFLHKAATSNVA